MPLSNSTYFALTASDPDMMLFYSLPNVSLRDRWFAEQKFSTSPELPIKVRIIKDNEDGKILAYHNSVSLMSTDSRFIDLFFSLRDSVRVVLDGGARELSGVCRKIWRKETKQKNPPCRY